MRYLKIMAGVIGTIVIGAIGSGVWDLFLKRFVLWLWELLAKIASVGLSSIQNVPYQNAAQGSPHDTILYLAFLAAMYFYGSAWGKFNPSPLWRISATAAEDEKTKINKQRLLFSKIMIMVIFFFLTFQIGQVRATYKIVDDFNHNIAALTPLVSPKEAATDRFLFTHMKSKLDYQALVARMTESAKASGVTLPR